MFVVEHTGQNKYKDDRVDQVACDSDECIDRNTCKGEDSAHALYAII